MRTIEYTNQFKRDYKRESKSGHKPSLDHHLLPVVNTLANDLPLAPNFKDHALTGNWKDFRDCHLKPDLILIYQLRDQDTLILVRIGSHSELGL